MSETPLRIAPLEEVRPLQASKWLALQLLIDEEEMASLLDAMGAVSIFSVGRVLPLGGGAVPAAAFLEAYASYVGALRLGLAPPPPPPYFSAAITNTLDHMVAVKISAAEQIIRPIKPVVQLQPHNMSYIAQEKAFHPLVFGKNSITWGLQIAYPQLWQAPESKAIEKVLSRSDMPNTLLFRAIQQWCRRNTVATPFICGGTTLINVPMRLGRLCLPWINSHPHLAEKGLSVAIERFTRK